MTVTSGSSTLIDGESFSCTCVAKPAASAVAKCTGVGLAFTIEVTLSNGAEATAPASFDIEWATDEATPPTGSKEAGPIAPGGPNEVVDVAVESGAPTTVTATSAGQTFVFEKLFGDCQPIS